MKVKDLKGRRQCSLTSRTSSRGVGSKRIAIRNEATVGYQVHGPGIDAPDAPSHSCDSAYYMNCLPRSVRLGSHRVHRTYVTATRNGSALYLSDTQHPGVTSTPTDLTPAQRDALDSALRVDQAGEVAANWIYKGQHFILGREPGVGPLIQVRIKFAGYDVLTCDNRRCGTKRRSIWPSWICCSYNIECVQLCSMR